MASEKITNSQLDNTYINLMKSNFFYGGKIIGAGGGGFFLMVLKKRRDAIKFLKKKKYNFINLKFDHLGVTTIN